MVLSTYKRHNAQAFNVIYNRLNLSKRPQVEWWILEHFLPTFDGHALYQYVLKSAAWSQGDRQAQLERRYKAMICSIPIPTPTELYDFAISLYRVWLEIEGNTPAKPVPLMKRVMELMTRGNRELEPFCGSMTFQSLFNSQLPQFNDFEKFLDILVEAYSMVLHNGNVTPTYTATAAAPLAPPPPPPQSDIAALA